MDDVETVVHADPELREPVLIEGLPGVGHVGSLVAEHLLSEAESELVRRLHSEHFPPQVTVGDEGVAELVCAELHAVSFENQDLLVLSGDQQAASGIGHYRITEAVLDAVEEFGVERLFALGGVPTGELIEEYDVLGAVSNPESIEALSEAGVVFREGEPAGGIVGISGLLVGLGGRRGLDASCLMGETSGYLVDPKSAKALLGVLQSLLGFEVDLTSLDERAEEMEEVVGKIQELEAQQQAMELPTDDDLRYIG
ncbi:proteasome assembly chaperone family protein [Natronorarus salvus]|uniref:proteasome assembly chaperone family protein n=1 Tax=Natronorarus salvus TaxID=3117733 RepID=UPI002F264040